MLRSLARASRAMIKATVRRPFALAAGAGLVSITAHSVSCHPKSQPSVQHASTPQPEPKSPMKKFFIACDGSPHSKEALLYALPYLAGAEVVIYVAHSFPAKFFYHSSSEFEAAAKIVAEEEARVQAVRDEALDLVTSSSAATVSSVIDTVPNRNFGEALVKRAIEHHADCIVMGTRAVGEVQSKILGSTSQSVLFQDSNIPVLIVHPGAAAKRAAHGHSVLLAVDGSELSMQAVDRGAAFVKEDSKVYLFHSAKQPQTFYVDCDHGSVSILANTKYDEECDQFRKRQAELEAQARGRLQAAVSIQLPKEDVHFVVCTNDGDASRGIENCMKSNKADLVVLGSRGHKGVSRVLKGSVAHQLLHDSEAFALLVCW